MEKESKEKQLDMYAELRELAELCAFVEEHSELVANKLLNRLFEPGKGEYVPMVVAGAAACCVGAAGVLGVVAADLNRNVARVIVEFYSDRAAADPSITIRNTDGSN